MAEVRSSWQGHYIGNKELFLAVCFAKNLHENEGKTMGDSIGISSNHYKIPFSTVAIEIMVDNYIRKVDGDQYGASRKNRDSDTGI